VENSHSVFILYWQDSLLKTNLLLRIDRFYPIIVKNLIKVITMQFVDKKINNK
jgi:hypothetical protein